LSCVIRKDAAHFHLQILPIVKGNDKHQVKPNTMPSSSVHARLHVVSSWVDKKQNNRIHVVISMPTGMHLLKKAEVVSTDSGSHLSAFWHWPQIMLGCDFVGSHTNTQIYKRSLWNGSHRMVSSVYLLFFGGFVDAWATQMILGNTSLLYK
jgi:hypothetical protein